MAKQRTVPIPAAGKHAVRRSSEDDWPLVTKIFSAGKDYPERIKTYGGLYANKANGIYDADGTYNGRPVYKQQDGYYSIYYRVSGPAANKWVLD
jgi:hypothetical protein